MMRFKKAKMLGSKVKCVYGFINNWLYELLPKMFFSLLRAPLAIGKYLFRLSATAGK